LDNKGDRINRRLEHRERQVHHTVR
jgi:hypothetical protein